MLGKPCDGGQVASLGVVGKVFKFHGPDHFLTKFGHVIPPWYGVKNSVEVFYMIRAKKMTDKLGLETFLGCQPIFHAIYQIDRAKRFIIIRSLINPGWEMLKNL